MMEYRYSERARREISLLGFGGWQLGNQAFWGEMTDEEAVDLVKEAIQQGVNFFDTAPGYSNGLSEQLIGEAVKGQREKVFINTKFGHHANGLTDFSVEKIEPAIRESMQRMQTDYIDSVILHNPEFAILEGKTDHFTELKRLKKLGIIRAYGVSIDSKEELRATLDHLDVDVIEIMFNIIHQEVAQYFDEAKERGILLVIKVPLDSGWLTGKYNKEDKFTGIRARWNRDVKATRQEIIDRIREIIKDENLLHVAIGFIASFNQVTTIIPGVRNLNQLQGNKQAVKYKLEEGVRDKLIALYQSLIVN